MGAVAKKPRPTMSARKKTRLSSARLKVEDVNHHPDELSATERKDVGELDHRPEVREVASLDPARDHAWRAVETVGEVLPAHVTASEPATQMGTKEPAGLVQVAHRHDSETLHYQCSDGQGETDGYSANAPTPGYNSPVSEPRKRGIPAEITDKWRDDAEAEMLRRGWKRKRLAQEVGCPPTQISLIFKRTWQGGSATSKWAAEVAEVLRVPLPITLPDWRGVLMTQMDELRRRNEQEFADFLDDLRSDLTRRLGRASARALKFEHGIAEKPPHGGPSESAPERGARHGRTPRTRR